MPRDIRLFTSESVTKGHPDKVCDHISDAVVDACIRQDPNARVACETLVKGTETGSIIVLAGEITVAEPTPDYEQIARQAALAIGYDDLEKGMDANTCDVHVHITTQSRDIARGVDKEELEQGAGDQGMMFGFACDESESFAELKGTYMPLPALLSLRLTRRLSKVREDGTLPWVRPDGKSQVTVRYTEPGKVEGIEKVVIATSHEDMVDEPGHDHITSVDEEAAFIRKSVIEHVIRPVIPEELFPEDDDDIIVNGTGRFVIGGPHGDAGVTGRKIIVDTYGGMGRHGGGAFSGKDPSKVDRSAAYAARWVAKHVVASGLATRCEIQLAYAIGVAEPMSVFLSCKQGIIPDEEIQSKILEAFNFRPGSIIRDLELKKPIYSETASGGHFGRTPSEKGHFSWERLDPALLKELRRGIPADQLHTTLEV
jgi:S-adenosylmethionine synthetase